MSGADLVGRLGPFIFCPLVHQLLSYLSSLPEAVVAGVQ